MPVKFIKYKFANGIGRITLNRPEILNSINYAMATELVNQIQSCNLDKQVRTILLTGKGKAFCAGQDLQEAMPSKNGSETDLGNIVEKSYIPIVLALRNCAKPILCLVNGIAAGAGANIALACDIVVASESAAFVQSFSKIGLIPDSGGTFLLPRIVGLQRATAMMMLGEKVTAQEALQLGMIYKVFSNDRIESEALDIANKLAQMPTKGLGLTKKGINMAFYSNLEDHLIHERDLQREAGKTKDYSEGISAFLQKRPANFTGE